MALNGTINLVITSKVMRYTDDE